MVEQRSDKEWCLPHRRIIKTNKMGKVRRVLFGAAKFHGTSSKKYLLTGPDLLHNLIYVQLRFRQHQFAVSADIEGMFLQVGDPDRDQPPATTAFFVPVGTHNEFCSVSIHAPNFPG